MTDHLADNPQGADGFITQLRLIQQQTERIERKVDADPPYFLTTSLYLADQRTVQADQRTIQAEQRAILSRLQALEDSQKYATRLILTTMAGMVASVILTVIQLVLK